MQQPVGGRADDPAWLALEAARIGLIQAFGDGALTVSVLDADGSMFNVTARAWRTPDALDLLRREAAIARAQQQTFLIEERALASWLRGEREAPITGPSAEPPAAKVRRGGADYRARDEPLCREMHRLVIASGDTPHRAAWEVVDRAAGHGTLQSKIKRLLKNYAVLFRPDATEQNGKD